MHRLSDQFRFFLTRGCSIRWRVRNTHRSVSTQLGVRMQENWHWMLHGRHRCALPRTTTETARRRQPINTAFDLICSPAVNTCACSCVTRVCDVYAKLQVLLKNIGAALPLKRGTSVLLTGPHATTTQDLGGKCCEVVVQSLLACFVTFSWLSH
jgi:hypothetical protein